MRVYMAWVEYCEDVLGIFTNKQDAESAVRKHCRYPHVDHLDMWHCGVTSYPLDVVVIGG